MAEEKTCCITGRWVLDRAKSTSQKDILRMMGRPDWQIKVIDQADEDFFVLQFRHVSAQGQVTHSMYKQVRIYLVDNNLLRGIGDFFQTMTGISLTAVEYKHHLIANAKAANFADDEKRFGPCSARTFLDNKTNQTGISIHWFLQTSPPVTLKVFHFINSDGNLQIDMECNGSKATKIYNRVDLKPEDKELIESHKFRKELLM